MKKALLAAVLVSSAFVMPAFAADSGQQPPTTAPTFEQRQAHMLKMIDERMSSLQAGKACVQAAKTSGDLNACRDKHMAEMREKRSEMMQQRGMGGPGMGGPGMGGPGAPMGK
jgi:hypothetical protein